MTSVNNHFYEEVFRGASGKYVHMYVDKVGLGIYFRCGVELPKRFLKRNPKYFWKPLFFSNMYIHAMTMLIKFDNRTAM
jgi:hypothetical protein